MKKKYKIIHSESKSAWNIVGTILGGKYKIARFPYITSGHEELDSRNRKEALEHANICLKALNNYNEE